MPFAGTRTSSCSKTSGSGSLNRCASPATSRSARGARWRISDTWRSALTALPQAHQVALDVLEVRRPAHLADGLPTEHGHPAELLDLRQRRVDVLDVDGDHRPVGRAVALEHPAADVAALGRVSALVHGTGLHDVVVQARDLVDRPPERVGVEL